LPLNLKQQLPQLWLDCLQGFLPQADFGPGLYLKGTLDEKRAVIQSILRPEQLRICDGLSGLSRSRSLGLAQEALNVFPECDLHFGLRMFKAGGLNGDGGLLAAPIPAIICEPELALDTEKGRQTKVYGMIHHRHSPTLFFVRMPS
jgi:hypothetical protein